jgi:hypothetical protein
MPETNRPYGSRFRDALASVNPGACNPSGIAHSIIEACCEIREHEPIGSTADDPAIRLMVYQLASVCGVPDYTLERYIADEAACQERLAELGLKPFGSRLTHSVRRLGIPAEFTDDE